MLNWLAFGKGSGWIALVACWVFITDCTYALKKEDLQRIGFVKVDSSSEDPAEEDGSENNGEDQQSRRYLDHLILGEADFSFTEALIRKHQKSYPDLPKHIIATELQPTDALIRGYRKTILDRIGRLYDLGMVWSGEVGRLQSGEYENFSKAYERWYPGKYLFNDWGHYSIANYANPEAGMLATGVDATKLHEIFPMRHEISNGNAYEIRGYKVTGFHFDRIHFNFPMALNTYAGLEVLMKEFFASASRIQIAGDRIHVTIPNTRECKYEIVEAASGAGYRLIKKHRFANRSYLKSTDNTDVMPPERYPGYLHNVNVSELNSNTIPLVRNGREYVFEKVQGISRSSDSEVETDDDSSDYLDDADGRWYTGDDMNRLMDHYFGQPADERYRDTQDLGLGRMHVINVEALDGEVLRQNLIQREREIYRQGVAVPQLLVPLNVGVGEGNHWIGLYINRMPDQAGIIQIFYFDSLGNPMPRRLQTMLREIYISRGVVRFYQNENCYQRDGYSCGAWVIEFFRAMHAIISKSLEGDGIEGLFNSGFGIDAAKAQHRKILHPNH